MLKKIEEIGIGILGYSFMGKAHSHAYLNVPIFYWPPPLKPKLIGICGRNKEAVLDSAQRYGYEKYYTNWKKLINNNKIELFDNTGPNNIHKEPCIAAAEAGKHVLCEKPLAMNSEDSKEMLHSVQKAQVKNQVGFNYRFVPAIRLAKNLIEKGELGKIYHFRARYLQSWPMDPKFPLVWYLQKETAGSGVLGTLGSHIIDLARFLVGEIKAVTGITKTFIKKRPLQDNPKKYGKVEVDDAFEAVVEFENGAIGTLEASFFSRGRKNQNTFEINGEKSAVEFDLEKLNQLKVYRKEDETDLGWGEINVTEQNHPFIEAFWPPGHIVGWGDTFINEIHHLLKSIQDDTEIAPYAANFDDGHKCNIICDAIISSAKTGKRVILNNT